ncbi:MAG: sigma-54-dependent Fis family transcriptional regulator [Myxococcales bacterium]
MPSLILAATGRRKPRQITLFKKITTLGTSPDNDVVLDGDSIEEHHAQVVFDGRHFVISAADRRAQVMVNDRKVRNHALEDGDTVDLGEAELRFSLYDEHQDQGASGEEPVEGLRKLVEFSERLMESGDIQALLETLLDRVVEITSADKGFLLLVEDDDQPRVRVARNIEGKSINARTVAVSDSIVRSVLERREAIIVSDALHDSQFSSSASVVNLKLCSVMCVPLVARGQLIGLIYLGNDNVVNLFTAHSLELLKVFASQAALIVRNALLLDELELSNRKLRQDLETIHFGEIIGACASMREVFKKIEKVATTDISVLIQGETGTGKELIAKEIHARSNRAKGPFVVINCGAIPENLLESELFGHVRGAFTGAVSTVQGKFQASNGGTLFLDEIGELPLKLQVKLLRALQERQVTKVGETRAEKVDIRVLAATNKVLLDEVRHNRFREDLYYRLNVISLDLPPLRDRGDDVLLIGQYLLRKYARELGSKIKDFSKEGAAAMRKHRWPGNIREMENRIKKAMVFADGTLITSKDLDLVEGVERAILPLADAREEWQRRYINKVLELNEGNRTKTARDLGVDPRTIFRHLEKEREGGDPTAELFEDEP